MKKLPLLGGMLALVASSSAFSAPLITLHMAPARLDVTSGVVLGLLGSLLVVMTLRIQRNKARNQ